MFKKLLLLTCISLNCLSARDFEKETGIRQGPFTEITKLNFQDEQIVYGNLVMHLKKAYELYAQQNKAWIEIFNEAVKLLEQINNDKTTECRALALQAAKHYNFEQLWTARHSLSGVVQNNLDTIAGTLPAVIQFFGAAGKFHGIYAMNKTIKESNITVTQIGGENFPVQLDGNGTVIARNNVGDEQAFPIFKVKFGAPTRKDALLGIAAVAGTQFKPNKFPESPKIQMLLLSAACFAIFFQAKDRDVSSPYMVVAQNGAIMGLTGIQIAQMVNTVFKEFHKPCPLAEMMHKLKQDQKEAQEEEEEEEEEDDETDDQNSVSTKPPTFIDPEYTAKMVDGKIHIEKKQPK
ncbi:hypothetical protein EBU95_06125 [bacterium]|nr:hypothetical protein [bacterium]